MDIRTRPPALSSAVLLAFIGFLSPAVLADEQTVPAVTEANTSGAITVEGLERAIAEMTGSADVTEDVKLQAIENYRAAIKNLESAADNDARLKTLTAEAETVALRMEQLKKQRIELKEKNLYLRRGLA